ncbi:MAG: FecCD family ABC transporter permease [Opitutales bacterium]
MRPSPFTTTQGWSWGLLGLGLVAAAWLNLSSGSMSIGPGRLGEILLAPLGFGTGGDAAGVAGDHAVVWSLRVPRVVLGIVAGASLAMAGAAIQGLFRNPLADPALIGVTSGGAMGAIVGILGASWLASWPLWMGRFAVPLGALAGALGVTALIYRLASAGGRTSVTTLLLVGIAVNALAGAVIGLALFTFSSAEELRSFVFWTLGSLDRASWPELGVGLVLLVPAALLLPTYARPLNLLLLGESEAYHLGVPVHRITRQVILLSAALAGTTVALTGTIGFVGLIVPHIARLLVGPDHRRLLPACALAGALLLLLADAVARTIVAPAVLPIGVLTALAGGPFFLLLLRRREARHA